MDSIGWSMKSIEERKRKKLKSHRLRDRSFKLHIVKETEVNMELQIVYMIFVANEIYKHTYFKSLNRYMGTT